MDNGTEFLGFGCILRSALRIPIRCGTDFTKVTEEQPDAVLALISNRPRKCLDYLSPTEYIHKVLHLA